MALRRMERYRRRRSVSKRFFLPEAEGLDYFIATSSLTLEESLDPDTRELAVGEAVTRSITVTVSNALSMVIPPVTFGTVDGLGVYPSPPEVTDSGGERGSTILGTRVDSASYVAEREGTYTLPAVELVWWDVENETLHRERLSEIELTVTPATDESVAFTLPEEVEPSAELAPEKKRQLSTIPVRRFLAVAVTIAVALWLLAKLLPGRVAPKRVVESESALFHQFPRRGACERRFGYGANAHGVARPPADGAGCRAFSRVREHADDPTLDREALALDRLLYATSSDARWSGRELYRRVARARDRRSSRRSERETLSPLNP